MDLYSIKNNTVKSVVLKPFQKERDIQELVEKNTMELFELELICSEFIIDEFRIDSLCFNNDTNSFTIIEYKKGSSYSVVDQGYSYLSKLLNNKDSFVLEYCRRKNVSVDVKIDWSQTKIIFVSPFFNSYQLNSVNFKDVPFELWEIKRFSNNTLVLNQRLSQSNESIKKIVRGDNNLISSVSKQVKVYTEDDFKRGMNNNIIEIIDVLKERLSDWDDVRFKFKKKYLGIWRNKKAFLFLDRRKDSLKSTIVRAVDFHGNVKKQKNIFTLDDPKKMFSNWDNKYKILYVHQLYDIKDIDYFVLMIKQKYDYVL